MALDFIMIPEKLLFESVRKNVVAAIEEDLGSGDVTASLIQETTHISAKVTSREEAIFCGKLWVAETVKQMSDQVSVTWHVQDGDWLKKDQLLFSLEGPAKPILSAERTILNFCQLLSGTATKAYRYSQLLGNSKVQILDTRKTIPGLRIAQKYAVECGGCKNHRIGLFDAFLIKENHIISCGGIAEAIRLAKAKHTDLEIEVEVENLEELDEAIRAGADIALIDNFNVVKTKKAVEIAKGKIKLEASGGISLTSLTEIAESGVDYISIGDLTKEVIPVDLSMRFEE